MGKEKPDEDKGGAWKEKQLETTFKKELPRYVVSLDYCLSDPVGYYYLNQYLAQQTGRPALGEFHRAFQIYRSSLAPGVRKDVAAEMFKIFFTEQARSFLGFLLR